MDESDRGKRETEELVAGLASTLGIDPMKLTFEWDRSKLKLDEHGLQLDQPVLMLTLHLEKRSEVLSFSEKLIRESLDNVEGFLLTYARYIVAVLKRLQRPEERKRSLSLSSQVEAGKLWVAAEFRKLIPAAESPSWAFTWENPERHQALDLFRDSLDFVIFHGDDRKVVRFLEHELEDVEKNLQLQEELRQRLRRMLN